MSIDVEDLIDVAQGWTRKLRNHPSQSDAPISADLIDRLVAALQDTGAANESAVLLRAALEFEYHAGNRSPDLSNDENRALSDANIRAAVHLRHLARLGFNPVASASPVPEGSTE